MSDMNPKQDFQNRVNDEFKEIFLRVAEAVESVDNQLACEIKWGRLTYGLSGDYHHWICGIAQTKKSINLIFHFGGLLDDKNKYFIVGDSFFLRKLVYSSINNVDIDVINNFLKQAINKVDYFKANWKTLSKNSK
jgi:hypothetical protein